MPPQPERHATPPTERSHTAAAVSGGKIYLIGGLTRTGGNLSSVERYDPASDSWERVADLPVGLDHVMAVSHDEIVYVLGGYLSYANIASDRVFRYDAARNTWQEVARMPQPRGEGGAAVLNGLIHVAGGLTPGGDPSPVFAYDPAKDAWRHVTDLPKPRGHLVLVAYRGHLCAIGGRDATQRSDCFNPTTGEWKTDHPVRPVTDWRLGPSPQEPRYGHGSAVVGNRVYMLGGMGQRPGTVGVESLTLLSPEAPAK